MLLLMLLFLPHGDLDVRIAEKTAEIHSNPSNLLLYMQRGMLHAQHEQPDSALMDYRHALASGLDTSLLHLLMAESFLEKGNATSGLESIETFLAKEPDHLKGVYTRAQLLEQSGDLSEAINDFGFVIDRAKSPRPQDFIQLSELYLKRNPRDVEKAVEVLDRGRKKLGNIISLEMRLLKLHKEQKNFEEAHAVVDRMMAPLSRKERLLVEKAELFLLQGEKTAAVQTLNEAEHAISALPPRFQNIGAISKLKTRITELKKQL